MLEKSPLKPTIPKPSQQDQKEQKEDKDSQDESDIKLSVYDEYDIPVQVDISGSSGSSPISRLSELSQDTDADTSTCHPHIKHHLTKILQLTKPFLYDICEFITHTAGLEVKIGGSRGRLAYCFYTPIDSLHTFEAFMKMHRKWGKHLTLGYRTRTTSDTQKEHYMVALSTHYPNGIIWHRGETLRLSINPLLQTQQSLAHVQDRYTALSDALNDLIEDTLTVTETINPSLLKVLIPLYQKICQINPNSSSLSFAYDNHRATPRLKKQAFFKRCLSDCKRDFPLKPEAKKTQPAVDFYKHPKTVARIYDLDALMLAYCDELSRLQSPKLNDNQVIIRTNNNVQFF